MIKIKGRRFRQKRVRAKIKGAPDMPRLNIFRSNLHIYGSLIDDGVGKTILSVSDRQIKKRNGKTKTQTAYEVGILLSKKAKIKKIKKVVFDRAGYKYLGRVKAFAEGARGGGLKF